MNPPRRRQPARPGQTPPQPARPGQTPPQQAPPQQAPPRQTPPQQAPPRQAPPQQMPPQQQGGPRQPSLPAVTVSENLIQDIKPEPQDIRVAAFAETGQRQFGEEVADMIEDCDLVVALGHVDLGSLARMLPDNKPALCVYGPRDSARRPPTPFRWLHGNGIIFKDWRIAGFSGALRSGGTPGFYLSLDEASLIIDKTPSCDILLSYSPPTNLPNSPSLVEPFESLENYLIAKRPAYQLYARSDQSDAEEVGDTLVIGVQDALLLPPLVFV